MWFILTTLSNNVRSRQLKKGTETISARDILFLSPFGSPISFEWGERKRKFVRKINGRNFFFGSEFGPPTDQQGKKTTREGKKIELRLPLSLSGVLHFKRQRKVAFSQMALVIGAKRKPQTAFVFLPNGVLGEKFRPCDFSILN